eukprot:CAMPEP_0174353534 /NCGR_PEP_ID=MMETSP0811_2-20130205/15519_1 /TAXON_ID=73025 ORGANISM="Eutreptiella gymnastica-like, Strain CCMP1594" /NCGR_SAMPLE_ID=MMETSP0811_2 /ASSEMBLY_ACC=CAM_ASM_000667 /LENGTH=132 /DNA_ID=CAMNT_0015484069 /DNA_START=62 /DNA_END=460 /DNA_ORIENTATION=-
MIVIVSNDTTARTCTRTSTRTCRTQSVTPPFSEDIYACTPAHLKRNLLPQGERQRATLSHILSTCVACFYVTYVGHAYMGHIWDVAQSVIQYAKGTRGTRGQRAQMARTAQTARRPPQAQAGGAGTAGLPVS